MKISKKTLVLWSLTINSPLLVGWLHGNLKKENLTFFRDPDKRVKKAVFVRTYDHQIFIKKHAKNMVILFHWIPTAPPFKGVKGGFFLEGKDCRGGFNFWWNCSILGSWCQRCSLDIFFILFFFFGGGGGEGLRDGTTTRRYLYIYHIMP